MPASHPQIPLRIDSLEIENFRAFENLRIDFTGESELSGNWTCVAGVNGAGKSTVLQALALLMLGPDRARELGGRRIQSMRRNGERATLRAQGLCHGSELSLEMTVDDRGPDGSSRFWSEEQHGIVFAGYGATRNLSDVPDLSEHLSDPVRACMSLFQAMTRLQYADDLLSGSNDGERVRGRRRFSQLLESVFDGDLALSEGGAHFLAKDAIGVRAMDLPDGFRSSVAWMADLCRRWAKTTPRKRGTLQDMAGLVLVDELDLHLHPSLQRSIVPRLRAALPNVQFVVSSHSPLVLASFDMNELVPLDSREEDGIRELDRQILGFTPNEIYEWLLGTTPASAALESELLKASSLGERKRLAQMLKQDPSSGPAEAGSRLDDLRHRLRNLKS